MRTLTWVSPLGVTKTVTVGGRKRQPMSSRRTVSLDSFEHFMFLQRERVASRLQRMEQRVNEARMDGMERRHINHETDIERRG